MSPAREVPLVRVVTVNWERAELTAACLHSLLATRWPAGRLELVVVDNGSRGDDVARLRAEFPAVRIHPNSANLGFAEGCNTALRDLGAVDYVALVNNDATVHPDWLAPLVDALEADPALGAVAPKILFAPRFVDVALRPPAHRAAPPVTLERVLVDGHDVTTAVQLRGGLQPRRGLDRPPATVTGEAVFRLPVPRTGPRPEAATLLLHGPAGGAEVTVGGAVAPVRPAGPAYAVTVPLPGADAGLDRDVINNVGNLVDRVGRGPDRGIFEVDEGQYDEPAAVPAWSGGGVLLRRGYLDDVGLFDPRLFTYYEDLDLALRGARRGWRYRTVPASVLFHAWGATTGAGSDRTLFFAVRNHLLCTLRNASAGRIAVALAFAAGGLLREAALAVLAPAGERRRGWRRLGIRTRALGSFLRLAPVTLAGRRQ